MLWKLRSSSRLATVVALLGVLLGVLLGCSSGEPEAARPSRDGTRISGAATTEEATSPPTQNFGNPTNRGTAAPASVPAAQERPAAPMGMASVIEPVLIDDCGDPNPAGLSAADAQSLMAGGGDAPRLLYPYDGTVFPRGMLPPTLMWAGDPADAVYVHIKSTHFEWHGCVNTTGQNQLELPAEVWRQASDRTLGTGDPFAIELTTLSGGTVHGPRSISVTIAQATIKGSLYYNSYVSVSSLAGSIYRIPPGGRAEVFLGGFGCYGCHTLSANGQRLISHTGGGPGLAYALDPNTQPNPPTLAPSPLSGFAGLSPDGSVYVASAHPAGAARPQGTPNELLLVNDAALYETNTGAMVPGSDVPGGAMMPTFSPDGTLLTFNDGLINGGRSISVMNFDLATRTASEDRVIFTDTDMYPGWPFVLPDSRAVVFARGQNPQFTGAGAGVLPGTEFLGPPSDLYIVDLATGTATILARAMGLNTPEDTTGYVPFGSEDLHKHYYPTISPVAAGGYFWLFFDSIRHYGNAGLNRQLWGTAISISPDGNYSHDPSHPAFYLPGQEFGTGNHRAFAALDACVQDGDSCLTGIDCCGGFCFIPEVEDEFGLEVTGTCTSETPECAKRDDRCTSDDDCCPPQPGDPGYVCIAGFCADLPPIL